MPKAKLSKQTPNTGLFAYNPFDGAQINVYNSRGHCRTAVLHPIHIFDCQPDPTDFRGYNDAGEPIFGRLREAYAFGGKLRITCDSARQIRLYVNGTESPMPYTIKYAGRTKKQRFASY